MRPSFTLVVTFLAVILAVEAAPLPDSSTVETVSDFIENKLTFAPDTTGLHHLIHTPSSSTIPTIISQYQNLSLNGDYEYGYVSENGIEMQEKGGQKEIEGPDGEKTYGTASSGKYSYNIVENGKIKKMTVVWTADENGFRPVITISEL